MIKGFLNITSNPRECFELSQSIPNTRIISLDEDDTYKELSASNNPNVIPGTILLPPIEAQWMEIDGNLEGYLEAYAAHMSDPNVTMFINSLIGFLYMGGNLIIFCPEFDAGGLESASYVSFILQYLLANYGLKLGTSIEPFAYDTNFIPKYLIGLYGIRVIDYKAFLLQFPLELQIPYEVMCQIILDSSIYGDSMEDKVAYINNLRYKSHLSGRIKSVIHMIGDSINVDVW